MNNLLDTLRNKGKEQKIFFNETELKEEKFQLNIELQESIRKIKEAQKITRTLRGRNKELIRNKEELINAISTEDKERINERIGLLIDKSVEEQGEVKRLLEENHESFLVEIDNSNISQQEKRISLNLHGSAVKQLQEVTSEFQSLECELKSINQGMILRSAEIALNRKLNKEEEDQIKDNPELAQEMIQNKLSGVAHSKVQNALRDLISRHDELVKLEKNIMMVHKLIEELAALVKLQGEMIDNICDNIATAKEDVETAEDDIFKSNRNMVSSQRLRWIIIGVVVLVLCIIVIPIVLKVTNVF